MKCPRCGREMSAGETFCPGCGWRCENAAENLSCPPQQPPTHTAPNNPSLKGWKIARAVLSVILYVGLMFGCQSCVMSGYMTSVLMNEGVLTSFEEDAVLAHAETLIEATNEKIVHILLIANLCTLLAVCLLFHLRRRSPAREMNVHFVNPFRFLTFALFGTALNIFVSISLSILPLPQSILDAFDTQYAGMYGNTHIAVEIFSVAVVAAVVEELIFRGIGMTRLEPVLGRGWAVVLTSVLFGLAHGTPIAVAYAAVLGLVFASLAAQYRSVVPTIICHIFFNLTSYWLAQATENRPVLTLGLYILSIGLILWCAYRLFVRYPTFSDVSADRGGRIALRDDEERAIVQRLHDLQENADSMDLGKLQDELEELEDRWEANRKNRKNQKK